MTTPPIPPPPAYAPTAGRTFDDLGPVTWWTAPAPPEPEAVPAEPTPEPTFEPEPSPEHQAPRVPFRVGYNAFCAALGIVPSPDYGLLGGWRTALHECAVQQSPAAALGLAVMGTGAALALDHYRGGWLWRTLLWATALGSVTTAAVFLGVVQLLTGAV